MTLLYCHQFVTSANISSKCLTIVKGNNQTLILNLWILINLIFKNALHVSFTYTQTETMLVCMSDCCVVKVGVVFSVVDKFQCTLYPDLVSI